MHVGAGEQGLFWIHVGLVGYKIYDYTIQVTYYDPAVSCLYLQLNILHCFIAITGLLFEIHTIQMKFDISLVIVWMIPICFKAGVNLRKFRLRNVRLLQKNDIDSAITLDLYVREVNILTNLDYKTYNEGENGVIFEKLFTSHILQCETAFSATKTCYCERYQKLITELTSAELLDAEYRRGFILFYIIDTYDEFFQKNRKSHDSKAHSDRLSNRLQPHASDFFPEHAELFLACILAASHNSGRLQVQAGPCSKARNRRYVLKRRQGRSALRS